MAENTSKKVRLTGSGATPLTYNISTAPLHGSASITKDSPTYKPAANYVGKDSLYFTVSWGCQKLTPAKVKITVTATSLTLFDANNDVLYESKINKAPETISEKVMPNPSTTFFTIISHSSDPQPLSIMVRDALGRIIE